jgi:microcystin degradation protein MlrC
MSAEFSEGPSGQVEAGCYGTTGGVAKMTKNRVLIAEFKHETNTFCSTKTHLKDYESRSLKFGRDIVHFFRGTRVEVGGFIDACEKENLEIIPTIAGNATPGGIVARDVYDTFKAAILEAIESGKGRIDGVLLSLHGAMVTEDHADGEGALLASLREALGPSVPILATLDLHANISPEMVALSDALFPYESYPHTDQYDRGFEAGVCLAGILRGELRPVMKMKRLPMLVPSMQTAKPPLSDLTAKIHALEASPEVINAAVVHGFGWADTPYTGMSVLAVTDGDLARAQDIVDALASEIMVRKEEFRRTLTPLDEAVRRGMDAPAGPVVLADPSDNPGGGGPGDGTHILSKLVELGVKNAAVAVITDPAVVQEAIRAGVGATIEVCLGGKVESPKINGTPVKALARVRTITDGVFVNKGPMAKGLENNIGRTVVLAVGGIDVIVPERRFQPWDPEIFRRMGIEPLEKSILVVKSSLHFRAAYEGLATEIIEVDTPGLLSSNFSNFTYRHLKRPVFPLDKI